MKVKLLFDRLKIWIDAFRLRTLPLAFSCIILGSILAIQHHRFQSIIFILAVLTTLFLQILANLANDYGDSFHGSDNENRIGPARTVQSGLITLKQMKTAIIWAAIFSSITGVPLIWLGTKDLNGIYLVLFIVLGLSSIAASIKYTAGSNPYGYAGFGDFFAFIFFGPIAVIGVFFLHTKSVSSMIILPAAGMGLLSAGVLNINNMRDIQSDQKSGKNTLAVKLGFKKSKVYHLIIIITACCLFLTYGLISMELKSVYNLLYLFWIPLFLVQAIRIYSLEDHYQIDPYLKKLALTSFGFILTFGVSILSA